MRPVKFPPWPGAPSARSASRARGASPGFAMTSSVGRDGIGVVPISAPGVRSNGVPGAGRASGPGI